MTLNRRWSVTILLDHFMNRRSFFKSIFVATAATIFVPKLIKVTWPRPIEPANITLLKALATGDRDAQFRFAQYIAPVIKNVLNQASTAKMIYADYMDEDDCPSFPLDLYYQQPKNAIVLQ